MKFKTYQSAIGIFIVSIVAIFLYIFLEDDLHKRIVVYSAFSIIIIWSALLINHRRKTVKKLKQMTKECILNQNSTGEFCDGVRRRMTKYAEGLGKTYEQISEEIRDQILNKAGGIKPYSDDLEPEKINYDDRKYFEFVDEPLIPAILDKKMEESEELATFVKLLNSDINAAYDYAAGILHNTYLNNTLKSELCKKLELIMRDSTNSTEYIKRISEISKSFNKSFDEASLMAKGDIIDKLVSFDNQIQQNISEFNNYDMNISNHDFILKKMIECIADTSSNGRICKKVETYVNLYANSINKDLNEVIADLKKSAISIQNINGGDDKKLKNAARLIVNVFKVSLARIKYTKFIQSDYHYSTF